jgi:hypothetical protein
MLDGGLQERSNSLAARVDALGAALRASGVSEAASARLLEAASTAVLHALTLELLWAPEAAVPAVESQPAAETEVPLAA